MISNWQADLPPKPEVQVIKIKSFSPEEPNLELRLDRGNDHSHVELWNNGQMLGYMHIDTRKIQWCSNGPAQWIKLSEDC